MLLVAGGFTAGGASDFTFDDIFVVRHFSRFGFVAFAGLFQEGICPMHVVVKASSTGFMIDVAVTLLF